MSTIKRTVRLSILKMVAATLAGCAIVGVSLLPGVRGGGGAAFAQQPAAPVSGDHERRLQRLERILENRILVEMLDRMEALQTELQALRGASETHANKIEGLKRRQKELYLDLDRRMQELERTGVGSPAAPPQAAADAAEDVNATVDANIEQSAYERAFRMLQEGRYDQAEGEFQTFLQAYPNGRYTANAQYWLGEVYYLKRDFDKAVREFSKVIDGYPNSTKRPNALLKKGFVHYEKGEWAEARASLQAVKQQYPETSAARLASNRLRQMSAEGR